ncbi:hypothetical protein KKJ09_16720 [Xenorhabdus bovienii]|nr:hypothetical protein [Xenorhabdus bovienii]MDE9503577.1 hypothetical protein [Xenorhabdus bovienii]MDE9570449.1 hypothetical protein [Xenorhabdus bovienii]
MKAEVNHSWRFYAYGRMRCKVLHNLLDRQTDRQTDRQKTFDEVEEENRRLKKIYAEDRLKSKIIQKDIEKIGKTLSALTDGKSAV